MNDRPLFYNGNWLEYNKDLGLFVYWYVRCFNVTDTFSTRILAPLHTLDQLTDEFDRDSFRKD